MSGTGASPAARRAGTGKTKRKPRYAAISDHFLRRRLRPDNPGRHPGYHHRQPQPAENHSLGDRPDPRSRGRAGLLFLFRTGPPQTENHLAPHLQAADDAPDARYAAPRAGSRPGPIRSSLEPAYQHQPRGGASRQPPDALYRRPIQDRGPVAGNRRGEAPHPPAVLHLPRRPHRLPRTGGPDPQGTRGGARACAVRRRGQQRRERGVLRADATRRNRNPCVPPCQVSHVHQQGQLSQPPQGGRHRWPRGIHRGHEHRRPLCGRARLGRMARHPFQGRGQRGLRASVGLPDRLGRHEQDPLVRPLFLSSGRGVQRLGPAGRHQRPVRAVADAVAGFYLRHRQRQAAHLHPNPLFPALRRAQHRPANGSAGGHRRKADAARAVRLESGGPGRTLLHRRHGPGRSQGVFLHGGLPARQAAGDRRHPDGRRIGQHGLPELRAQFRNQRIRL